MASSNVTSPSILCAESISILNLLHSVVKPPSRNLIAHQQYQERGYLLSLSEERQLVEALAFLANDREDIDHIPALCVQQDSRTLSLNVLLAVNRSGWQGGSQTVQRLKLGFEQLFALLATDEPGSKVRVFEDDILTAIVTMCTQRILQRIRFVRGKRSVLKQPIQDGLRAVIDCIKQLEKGQAGSLDPDSVHFIKSAKAIITAIETWNKHQTTPRLKQIVNSIHLLNQDGDIEATIGNLNNHQLAPSNRKSLVNIIRKVSRYCEIARYLYRTTRKCDLLRSVTITPISLPSEAYNRTLSNTYTPSLTSALKSMYKPLNDADTSNLYRAVGVTELQAIEQFSTQATKTLRKAKIHAEVQLVCYCDLQPLKLPPRLIASSKDACFLCNAFIVMHGKMHITRTHGRLYPGWRLPANAEFAGLVRKFNAVLASQIRASIATTLSRGKKIVFPDPNESTLLTLPYSASTLHSRSVQQAASEHDLITQCVDPDPPKKQSSLSTVPTEAERTIDGSDVKASNIVSTASTPIRSSSSAYDSSHSSSEDEVELVQGRATKAMKTSKFYTAGTLNLHIVYPANTELPQPGSTSHKLCYNLEWLSLREQRRLRTLEKAEIVEIGDLKDEWTCEVDEQGQLFLAVRGIIVKMSICSQAS